jgi:preprotein translocase subunit SecG
MTILLTIVHIVVCFFLIAVILLQAGKGQGLAGAAFGGGGVDSLLGTKGADFLTKVTTVVAISFMVTCLGLSMLETHKSRSLLRVGQNTAPIDVDQIKKALEKVKAEAESKGDTETVKKMNDIDSTIVFEDTKMLILDAISEFNFKKLCRVYKKVCNKNYLVED